MGAKPVERIPALRFPEFDGEWDDKPLKELSKNGFSNGVFNDPKKVGKGYKLINVKDMYIGDSVNVEGLTLIDMDEKDFQKNKVEYGDIFFTRSSLVKEGIAHSNVNLSHDNNITYDGHLIRMRPDPKYVYPEFLAYFFRTSSTRRQFIVRGKTTTMTTIGQEDLGTVLVTFPSLPEQQKIAAFLTSVDTRIQQLTQKKDLLQQYKKGVMQQIFAREIRFRDDQGRAFPDWEERRLGEIGRFIGGGTPSTKNPEYWNGTIPWVSSSDLSDDNIYHVKAYRYISQNAVINSATKVVPKNSILIVSRVGVGKIAINSFDLCTSQDFTNLKVNQGNTVFLAYLLKRKILALLSFNQGTSIKGFLKSDLESFLIETPSLPEQQKIAAFLSAIDVKIDQVGKQLEGMQRFKKGLLQQMFV